MFLDYKIAHSKDPECTELLDVFSPADALHVKYPLSPVKIYATKQEVELCKDRLGIINITEIGEAQAMMEMVRYEYINNLDKLSTDIVRMHMDPEFWYQQHILGDTHHLNNHMIEMIQKYIGEMQPEWKHTSILVLLYTSSNLKHCKGIFARSKLSMEAIRSMHADFYNLPDDTRYNASAKSSNKIKMLEEEVTIDDREQSLQTISPILSSEGTDTQCINQKAHLMSEQAHYFQTGSLGWRGITSIAKM